HTSTGPCDATTSCTGSSGMCPSSLLASGTPCADDGDPCTLDQCDGKSATCQHPSSGDAGGCTTPPTRVFTEFQATALPFVTCSLVAGSQYVFSTTAGSPGADTVLHLLDPTGAQVGFNDDCAGTLLSTFPCTGTWTAPTTGNYTLVVRAYSSQSSGSIS